MDYINFQESFVQKWVSDRTTGPEGDVLKLRPLIVFRKEHAEITLVALVRALDELSN